MSNVVVKAEFRPAGAVWGAGLPEPGAGEVIAAAGRFRRVGRLWRRCYAIVSFLVLCPLLLFGADSSLRIVDSLGGSRSVVARQRQS
jgi:hypothetical protein